MSLVEANIINDLGTNSCWPTNEIKTPDLTIIKERWAKVRLNKVEFLAEVFNKNPNIGYVFEDSKLKGNSLILIRKNNIEQMLNIINDIKNGQAFLQVSAEEVNIQLSLLEKLVSEKLANKPCEDSNSIQDIIKLLNISFSKISSKLLVFSKNKKRQPRPLSNEELKLLEEDE